MIEAIAARLSSGFDPAHALIVRPLGSGWQIVSGHNRKAAARKAKLAQVPCWVRELGDTEAYMMLLTCNAQGELTALERGLHALNSRMDIKAYAGSVGREKQYAAVKDEVYAARVASACDVTREPPKQFSQLVEIHTAPRDNWPSLVNRMIDEEWTVERTRHEVALVKPSPSPLKPRGRSRLSIYESVSLEQWQTLDKETQTTLLPPDPDRVPERYFNKQESDAIEWAQWSWNPITGCLHDCPYCYARDLALGKAASAYPNGFAPTLRPASLLAARRMQVPLDAASDWRYRNVFTGSMADVFGRWVPREWIEAVLAEIRAAPEWSFLCLTKFPKRMAEFDIPANAWMGTTVDLQARVAAAEAGFANVGAGVRWLSCEPLIEPLRFKHLDRFNWIVIGGASWSTKTPKWQPPFEWVADLVRQARDAGLKIYMKTNLGIEQRILELPFDAPIPSAPTRAPPAFHYLRKSPE